MSKFKKWFKVSIGLLFAGFILSGCTANFCSNRDIAIKWYNTYGTVEKRDELLKNLSATVDIPSQEFWTELDEETINIATKEYQAKGSSDTNFDTEEILQSYVQQVTFLQVIKTL